MTATETFPLAAWLAQNRSKLRPPTSGFTVFNGGDLMFTVVGANSRTDYHVNPFEELFYQLEGAMTLRIQKDGRPHDVAIAAGHSYLLPARVPHAPQRPEGTVGLIVERVRRAGEIDAHEWYCAKCNTLLFRKEVFIEVLERDMPPVFEAYYGNPRNQICPTCGFANPGRPGKPG